MLAFHILKTRIFCRNTHTNLFHFTILNWKADLLFENVLARKKSASKLSDEAEGDIFGTRLLNILWHSSVALSMRISYHMRNSRIPSLFSYNKRCLNLNHIHRKWLMREKTKTVASAWHHILLSSFNFVTCNLLKLINSKSNFKISSKYQWLMREIFCLTAVNLHLLNRWSCWYILNGWPWKEFRYSKTVKPLNSKDRILK